MTKKITLTLLVLIICLISNAQFIDNYGIKFGAGLSNQYWEYKTMFSNLSGWKKDKIGFTGQVYVEKYLGKFISFRPAIGYIQKGYVDDVTLINEFGEELAIVNDKVVFYDLSLDLSFKIIPFQKRINPYIILGIRGDNLMDYRNVIVNFGGENHEINNDLFDDFNKFILSGLIGCGISYNDFSFIEFEYNPAFSKNFNSDFLEIHDRYFSLTLGINMNKLIKDKKK